MLKERKQEITSTYRMSETDTGSPEGSDRSFD